MDSSSNVGRSSEQNSLISPYKYNGILDNAKKTLKSVSPELTKKMVMVRQKINQLRKKTEKLDNLIKKNNGSHKFSKISSKIEALSKNVIVLTEQVDNRIELQKSSNSKVVKDCLDIVSNKIENIETDLKRGKSKLEEFRNAIIIKSDPLYKPLNHLKTEMKKVEERLRNYKYNQIELRKLLKSPDQSPDALLIETAEFAKEMEASLKIMAANLPKLNATPKALGMDSLKEDVKNTFIGAHIQDEYDKIKKALNRNPKALDDIQRSLDKLNNLSTKSKAFEKLGNSILKKIENFSRSSHLPARPSSFSSKVKSILNKIKLR